MSRVSDPDAFKALAHPLRIKILKHLDTHGPATATALGAALGTTSGTTSYHLRRLERHGFVEDDPDTSNGRERGWRWAGGRQRRPIVFADFDELDPATRAVAAAADRALFDDDRALASRFAAEHRRLGAWAAGARASRHMTTEQLASFNADFRALLDRHGSHPDDAPPEARPIELRFFALPADTTGVDDAGESRGRGQRRGSPRTGSAPA